MKNMDYDVIIAGGGIAGSTAARFLAQYGMKTLLVERHKTPRNERIREDARVQTRRFS